MQEKYIHQRIIQELTVRFLDENLNMKYPSKPYKYYICFDLEELKRNDLKLADLNMVGYILQNVYANYLEGDGCITYSNPMIVEKQCTILNFNDLMTRSIKFISYFNTEYFNSQYPDKSYDKTYNHLAHLKKLQKYIRFMLNTVLPPEAIRNNYNCCGFLTEFNGYGYIKNNKKEFTCNDRIQYNIMFKNGKDIYKNKEKESNKMNVMKGMNFEFGPVGKEIKLAVGGMAFRNDEGRYVIYNIDTNAITDVTDFTFDINGMLYAMPVAIDQIKKNDVINHKGNYVIAIADFDKEKGNIDVVNPITQTEETILPTQNIFGFNFVTKVVNFAAGMFDTTPNADNPFGNIMPMILMSSVMNDDTDSNDFMKMMVMGQVMQNGNFFQSAEDNPFSNMMPFMMMKSIMGDN